MNVLMWDKVEEPNGTSAGGQFKPLSPKFLWSLQHRVHFGKVYVNTHRAERVWLETTKIINKKLGGISDHGVLSYKGDIYITPYPQGSGTNMRE